MNISTIPQVKYGPPPMEIFSNSIPEILMYIFLPIALIAGLVIYFKKRKKRKTNSKK